MPSSLSSHTLVAARWSVFVPLALAALGATLRAQTPPDTIPPRWYSGDTHAHIQLCGEPIDLTAEDVHAALTSQHLDVACTQVWAKFGVTPATFLSEYAPLVTGAEHPVSTADPDAIVQFGVEVSGFQASQFGHVQALHVQDGAFPTAALHPEPVLDFFAAQQGAVTGYAHVLWWEHYWPASIGGGGGGGAPFMAPIDAALGSIDFLEARRIAEEGTQTWRGLHYKLLNAGLRVALVGGSDNSCVTEQIGDTRTWARIAQEPLTFTRWCEAVARRETSVSDGSGLFLDLRVGDAPIGSEVGLASTGVLDVRATLHVSTGLAASGRLSLIMNGTQVASKNYDLPAGGKTMLAVPVHFARSAWIAAAADSGAHTGATYVSVGDRPIATVKDAAYWRDYCDDLEAQIGLFHVPPAVPDILERVDAARKIFTALEAVGLPLPAGVTRYGHSTPACRGPIAIGVDSPPSQAFRVTCLNAPPDTTGLLLIGPVADTTGTSTFGADVFVELSSSYSAIPVQTNGGGYAEAPITLPSGTRFVCQFVWTNTAGCGGGGPLSASDALDVHIP